MNIRLSKEDREQILDALKEYFYQERGEEIGDLAAHNLSDYLTKHVGPHFYNQGVKDAIQTYERQMMNISEDLHALEVPIKVNRR